MTDRTQVLHTLHTVHTPPKKCVQGEFVSGGRGVRIWTGPGHTAHAAHALFAHSDEIKRGCVQCVQCDNSRKDELRRRIDCTQKYGPARFQPISKSKPSLEEKSAHNDFRFSGPQCVQCVQAALEMGAQPYCRLTLWETEDEEGDQQVMALVAQALCSSPGRQAVAVVVRALDGRRHRFLFRAEVMDELRQRLAELAPLRARRPQVRLWALRNALAHHLRGWEKGRLLRWRGELQARFGNMPPDRWLEGWRRYEGELRRAAEAWPLWRAYLWACLERDEALDLPPYMCWLCLLAAGQVSLDHHQAMAWWRRWQAAARNCPLHEVELEVRPWQPS